MATLTASARRHIAASKFGIKPRDGKPGGYPMEDRAHAAAAKSRASAAEHAGRMSAGTEARIDAMANRILGSSHKH
jgi:hypothetical protein